MALRLWPLLVLWFLAAGCGQEGEAIKRGVELIASPGPRPETTGTVIPPKVLRAQYFVDVGKLETQLGAYQAAISAFESALQLDPDNAEAKKLLEETRKAVAQATPAPSLSLTLTSTPVPLFIPPSFVYSPTPAASPTIAPTATPTSSATPQLTATPTAAPLGCLGDEKLVSEPASAAVGDRVIISAASARGHQNVRLAAPGPTEFLGLKVSASGYLWQWSTTTTAKGSLSYFFYVDYNTLCAFGTFSVTGRWQPLSSGLPSKEDFKITAIGVSPNFPLDGTLFLGFDGKGVFRSTNANALTTTFSEVNKGLINQAVLSLGLSPNYSRDATLFVGTRGSFVFRSTNGGESWTQLSLPAGLKGDVTALAVSPNFATDSTVFAGIDGSGAFISPDRGANWFSMNNGLHDRSVQALAISADYANDGTLFAGGKFSGAYRFTPPIAGQPQAFTPRPAPGISPKFCLVSTVPVVGPGTPVPTQEKLRCLSITVTAGNASDKQVQTMNKPGFVTYTYFVINDEGKGPLFDIEIKDDNGTPEDPSDDAVIECDGKPKIEKLNLGESKTCVGRFYVAQDRTSVVKATARAEIDGQTVILTASDDALVDAPEWSPINTGLEDLWIWSFAISPFYANDRTIFAGSAFGGLFKHDGQKWTPLQGGLKEKWAWVKSVVLSPRFPNEPTVYAGARSGVYRTTDGGSTWVLMKAGIPEISSTSDANSGVKALAISPDFANDRMVFAGVWLDNIYRVID